MRKNKTKLKRKTRKSKTRKWGGVNNNGTSNNKSSNNKSSNNKSSNNKSSNYNKEYPINDSNYGQKNVFTATPLTKYLQKMYNKIVTSTNEGYIEKYINEYDNGEIKPIYRDFISLKEKMKKRQVGQNDVGEQQKVNGVNVLSIKAFFISVREYLKKRDELFTLIESKNPLLKKKPYTNEKLDMARIIDTWIRDKRKSANLLNISDITSTSLFQRYIDYIKSLGATAEEIPDP